MGRLGCVIGVLVVALGQACGGSAQSDLTSDGGNNSGSSSGSSSGGSGSGSGADSGSDGHGGDDGGRQDAPSDVQMGETSSSSSSGGGVLCPMNGQPANCMPGESCCVMGDPGAQTDSCNQAGATCTGVPVSCARNADCPQKEICCGVETGTGMSVRYVQVSCQPDCVGAMSVRFCDPANNDCPSTASHCNPSTLLTGYNVCRQ